MRRRKFSAATARMQRPGSPAALALIVLLGVATTANGAAVILNEYNAVRSDRWLDADGAGASTKQDTFFGRIQGNGGDWLELVVIGDGSGGGTVDMRGWSVDITIDGNAAGTLILNNNSYWQNVQNGTILTFVESDTAGGFDTSTQIKKADHFNTLGYAWSNFYIGDIGTGPDDYFAAGSSLDIMDSGPGEDDTHDNAQFTINDSTPQVVFGPAGEGVQPLSGVNSRAVFKLQENPSTAIDEDEDSYAAGTSSSFGSPNVWSDGAGVQNFSALKPTGGPSDLVWDANTTNAAADDGPGTWIDGGNNWFDGTTNDLWENSQPDNATFGSGGTGTATVTLSGPIITGDLAFEEGTIYTLAGGDGLIVQGEITANHSATIDSDLTLTTTNASVQLADSQTLTLNGQLLGSDPFEVHGDGTLVLSADNSAFDDTITVTNNSNLEVTGRLSVDGLIWVKSSGKLIVAAGAAVGEVFVDSGSQVRIEGDGTIGGELTMDDNDAKVRGNLTVTDRVYLLKGVVSPGESNSPGLLTFQNDLTIGEDLTYTWQLFDDTDLGGGTNFDLITVGDQLKADEDDPQDPNFTSLVLDIEMRDNVDMNDPFWTGYHSWTIINVGRQDNFTSEMLSIGDILDVDDDPLAPFYADRFGVGVDGGGNVVVTYVPEPGSVVSLAAGAVLLLLLRRPPIRWGNALSHRWETRKASPKR